MAESEAHVHSEEHCLAPVMALPLNYEQEKSDNITDGDHESNFSEMPHVASDTARSLSTNSETPRNNEPLVSDKYLNLNCDDAPKVGCHTVGQIDSKTYHTLPGLKLRKSYLLQEVSMIDDQIKDMNDLKQIIKRFSSKMKEFSAAILKLDRNRQGVPYVANVKALFQKINQELNEETTKHQIGKINAHDVPFVIELNLQFRSLNKITEQVIIHHVNYHVTYLENFHWVAGKIRGMMKAIIGLYYTDDIKSDEFSDKSFDHLVIQSHPNKDDSSRESDDDNDPTTNGTAMSMSPRETHSNIYCNGNLSPQRPPSSLFDGCNSMPPLSARSNESIKNLDNLRLHIREANQILGSIHRLSLGNPKIQSLRDYFSSVGNVLSRINLTALKVKDVPFANKIESAIVKMIRLSSLKHPSERHIEQMKLLLGEVDGRVHILMRNLTS